jgi:myo-inositol-1(or 4)-monophosphatase
VSVAVVSQGEPVVACIVDPVRQEVFTAGAGLGAWRNGMAMRVAGTDTLAQAVAATVFPKPKAAFMEAYLGEFNRVVRQCAGVRRSGSMALELAYLAAGRLDAVWERGMGAWDAAAGLLLIREAGGIVWALDGRPWWDSAALAACAPGLEVAWGALLKGGD